AHDLQSENLGVEIRGGRDIADGKRRMIQGAALRRLSDRRRTLCVRGRHRSDGNEGGQRCHELAAREPVRFECIQKRITRIHEGRHYHGLVRLKPDTTATNVCHEKLHHRGHGEKYREPLKANSKTQASFCGSPFVSVNSVFAHLRWCGCPTPTTLQVVLRSLRRSSWGLRLPFEHVTAETLGPEAAGERENAAPDHQQCRCPHTPHFANQRRRHQWRGATE